MLMGSVSERRLVLINQGGVQKKDSVLKPSSNLAIGGYRRKRCQMPWVLLMKKKTHWQFSGTASFVKNADFVCCYGEIIRRPAAASILMPATFHIAHLYHFTQTFSSYQKFSLYNNWKKWDWDVVWAGSCWIPRYPGILGFFQNHDPGIPKNLITGFLGFPKALRLNDCIPRLSTPFIDHINLFWDIWLL